MTFIVNRLIFLLLLFQFFYINIYAQTNEKIQSEKAKRVIFSTDLETLLSTSGYLNANNVFLNLLYEKELRKRISLLYGIEYQKLFSGIIINGQLMYISELNYYYIKAKSHFYLLPYNKEKHSGLNGLYIGPSFKIGAAKTNTFNYLVLSPGIFIGSCFVLSNRFIINIEFDFDGYMEWEKEINTNEGYYYQGLTNIWMNLWFSVGYRF